MIIYIYIYDITSNNVYKETFIIILKSNSLLLLGYPLLTVVFFLFLSLLLCYMLRFVSLPNKRRYIYKCKPLLLCRGVHPSETMMHFPLFQISPLFSKNFRTLRKIFTILPFPNKFLDFHPPKFLMTFFSHQPQISNLSLFSLF